MHLIPQASWKLIQDKNKDTIKSFHYWVIRLVIKTLSSPLQCNVISHRLGTFTKWFLSTLLTHHDGPCKESTVWKVCPCYDVIMFIILFYMLCLLVIWSISYCPLTLSWCPSHDLLSPLFVLYDFLYLFAVWLPTHLSHNNDIPSSL